MKKELKKDLMALVEKELPKVNADLLLKRLNDADSLEIAVEEMNLLIEKKDAQILEQDKLNANIAQYENLQRSVNTGFEQQKKAEAEIKEREISLKEKELSLELKAEQRISSTMINFVGMWAKNPEIVKSISTYNSTTMEFGHANGHPTETPIVTSSTATESEEVAK